MPSAIPVKRLWLLAALVVIAGGWMAFDGAHALVTGDFVTPSSGEYAGQLGPWSTMIRSVGLNPRSLGVKISFLVFGLIYLGALVAFLLRRKGSWLFIVSCSAIALVYLPLGTVTSLAGLAVLATLRSHRTAPAHE